MKSREFGEYQRCGQSCDEGYHGRCDCDPEREHLNWSPRFTTGNQFELIVTSLSHLPGLSRLSAAACAAPVTRNGASGMLSRNMWPHHVGMTCLLSHRARAGAMPPRNQSEGSPRGCSCTAAVGPQQRLGNVRYSAAIRATADVRASICGKAFMSMRPRLTKAPSRGEDR